MRHGIKQGWKNWAVKEDTNWCMLKWNEMKWIVGGGTVGGSNKREANGRKKSRPLLWLATLTCSCCAQRQSIRHSALLLMSFGNKSEEAELYFAAWVTCRSPNRPMCLCIPPTWHPPGSVSSLPLVSLLLSVSSIHYADSLFFSLCLSLVCISLFISLSSVHLIDNSACICAW